jgi:DNA mismatch endonuclease (patch repair protein)
VLPARRLIFLVHGCFWHRHPGCRFAYEPKSRVAFWTRKFAGNIVRDRLVARRLRGAGWSVHVVWECETRERAALERRLARIVMRRPR